MFSPKQKEATLSAFNYSPFKLICHDNDIFPHSEESAKNIKHPRSHSVVSGRERGGGPLASHAAGQTEGRGDGGEDGDNHVDDHLPGFFLAV